MIPKTAVALLFASSAIAQLPAPAPSIIFRVPQDFATIQSAVNVANAGDTVLVTMSQDYNESPTIAKNIKVIAKANSGTGRLLGRFVILGTGPSMQLRGFKISNPVAQIDGGGLQIDGGSPTIRECVIENCTALGFGGGIAVLNGGGPAIKNCKILTNHSLGGSGGGIHADQPNNMLVLNSFISGNTVDGPANGNGGGISLDKGVTVIRNCTITNNSAIHVPHGGGIFCTGIGGAGQVSLQNSIVWNNSTDGSTQQQISVQAFCTFDVNFTCIMNGQAGIIVGSFGVLNFGSGNISADPLFVDGLHITPFPFSPCLNAGDTSLMTPGETDIDGEARWFSVAIDMGCDEYVLRP